MKVYTRIEIDMITGETLQEESYEYSGEVAYCGGGSGGDFTDEDFNKRIADIAEEREGRAEEMFNFYKYGKFSDVGETQYNVGGEWLTENEARERLSEVRGPQSLEDVPQRRRHVGSPEMGRVETQYNVGGEWLPRSEAEQRIEEMPGGGEIDLSQYSQRVVGGDTDQISPLELEQRKMEENLGLIGPQADLAQTKIGLEQAKANALINPDIWGAGGGSATSTVQEDASQEDTSRQPTPEQLNQSYLQGLAQHYNQLGYRGKEDWTPEAAKKAIEDAGMNVLQHRRKYGGDKYNPESIGGSAEQIEQTYLQNLANKYNQSNYTYGGYGGENQWTPEKVRQAISEAGYSDIQSHMQEYGGDRYRGATKDTGGGSGGAGGGAGENTGGESYPQNKFTRQAELEKQRMGLQEKQVGAKEELLPLRTGLEKEKIGLQEKQIGAKEELLPLRTGLEKERIGLQEKQVGAKEELLPLRTGLEKQRIGLQRDVTGAQRELLPQAQGLASDYMSEAQEGVDIDERMGLAQADVASQYQGAGQEQRMQASRMGLQPGSGAFRDMSRGLATKKARDMAAARTKARTQAEQEDFQRKRQGARFGFGLYGS